MEVSLERAAVASTKALVIVNELLFASLAIFFFVKIFKRTLSQLGLTTARLLHNVTFGLLVGVGGWLAAVALAFLLTRLVPYEIPEWFTEMLTATSPLDLAIFLLLTWVLIGPCEEIFFRGFVQGTFAAWKGPVVGLIVGSILFGLAHFDPVTWIRTIPSTFLGLVYGVVYAKKKSITVVAVAHSVNDTIGFVLAFLAG